MSSSLDQSKEIILGHYEYHLAGFSEFFGKYKAFSHIKNMEFELIKPKSLKEERYMIQVLNTYCADAFCISIDSCENLCKQVQLNLKKINEKKDEFMFAKSNEKFPIEIIIYEATKNEQNIELEMYTIDSFILDSCIISTKFGEFVSDKLPFESKISLSALDHRKYK